MLDSVAVAVAREDTEVLLACPVASGVLFACLGRLLFFWSLGSVNRGADDWLARCCEQSSISCRSIALGWMSMATNLLRVFRLPGGALEVIVISGSDTWGVSY